MSETDEMLPNFNYLQFLGDKCFSLLPTDDLIIKVLLLDKSIHSAIFLEDENKFEFIPIEEESKKIEDFSEKVIAWRKLNEEELNSHINSFIRNSITEFLEIPSHFDVEPLFIINVAKAVIIELLGQMIELENYDKAIDLFCVELKEMSKVYKLQHSKPEGSA